MRFFDMDESGTNLNDKNLPYFILAAIEIESQHWTKIDENITEIKHRLIGLSASSEDFELKGRDIRQGNGFFRSMNWQTRVQVFQEIADLIANSPCHVYVVAVEKAYLPDTIQSEEQLYRLAFLRMLDRLDTVLDKHKDEGLIMMDMRSPDPRHSTQDRIVIDAFRLWQSRRQNSRFVELPWFGISHFYMGIQLADLVAYLHHAGKTNKDLADVYQKVSDKMDVVTLP